MTWLEGLWGTAEVSLEPCAFKWQISCMESMEKAWRFFSRKNGSNIAFPSCIHCQAQLVQSQYRSALEGEENTAHDSQTCHAESP